MGGDANVRAAQFEFDSSQRAPNGFDPIRGTKRNEVEPVPTATNDELNAAAVQRQRHL